MKFIIDRKTWYRGRSIGSRLHRMEDDKKCCMGFIANQCGIELSKLTDRSTFAMLDCKSQELLADLGLMKKSNGYEAGDNGEIARLYIINDEELYSDGYREQKIKEGLAILGHEVEFVN